jgi:hypothetical protein
MPLYYGNISILQSIPQTNQQTGLLRISWQYHDQHRDSYQQISAWKPHRRSMSISSLPDPDVWHIPISIEVKLASYSDIGLCVLMHSGHLQWHVMST